MDCPTPGSPATGLGDPRTWAWGGRLPPRLYHVIWVWASPATTQLRSRVCPSVTEDEEDSILTGGVVAPRIAGGVGRSEVTSGGPWLVLLLLQRLGAPHLEGPPLESGPGQCPRGWWPRRGRSRRRRL